MKRFGIISMFLLLLTACQEELNLNNFEAGLPAALSLDLTVPTSSEVTVTKGINDYESEIRELALILTSGNSVVNVVDLTGNLTSQSTTDKGGRTYKLANPVTEGSKGEILSGTYTIYGIANWSSPFCNLTLDQIEGFKDVNAMKAALASNPGFVLKVTGLQLFPMSGVSEGVNILPLETSAGNSQSAPNGNSISLTLTRVVSHIEFIFKNGTNDENPKFTPTSYSIYNLPMEAKLLSAADNKVATEYGHQTNLEIAGSDIQFFMLENVMPAGENTTYAERDKWTGDKGAAPENKDFIYAPEGSTFVVVSGEYSGKSYFGNVSYTIHLGNFSGKSTDRSPAGNNNYTVNRNEYHKYTVTVNGVSSIVTESTVEKPEGGDVPAAEGELTQLSNRTQFVLDAHYETAMLTFSLDEKCKNPSMIIRTPYTNGTEKYMIAENNYSEADYKWIHFMAPTSTSTLPKYNPNKVCTIDVLANELKQALNNGNTAPSGAHFIISNGKVYTTAFIDEYYYEGEDWTTFVNTDNRIIILNPDEQVSVDGNSISYPDYIFSVAQRSIKTTYPLDSELNAFGIETWNETGRSAFSGNYNNDRTSDFSATLTVDDGWSNTKGLWNSGSLNVSWINYGYLQQVNDNTKESHVFYSSGQDGLSGVYSYNACLTRNRDEDNDGKIDDNEIKWYLPAIQQYTTLWMGIDYLTDDTQLVNPQDIKSASFNNDLVNFYSSSSYMQRMYYPAEGSSFGQIIQGSDGYPNDNQKQGVRCVRSLKKYNEKASHMSQLSGNIIEVLGASALTQRSSQMSGEYAKGHNERSADNKLYTAFEVASENLKIVSDASSETFTITALKSISASGATVTFAFPHVGYTYSVNAYGNTYTANGTGIINLPLTYNANDSNGQNTWATVTVVNNTTGNSGKFVIWFDYSGGSYRNSYKFYKYDESTANQSPWGFTTDALDNNSITLSSNGGERVKFSAAEILNDDLCAGHYTQEDGADLGKWRVPNQREFQLMIDENVITDAKHYDYNDSRNVYYATSTVYQLNTNNIPFVYIGTGFTRDPGNTLQFYIRCVRDADPITSEPGSGSGSGSGSGNTGDSGDSGGEL